MNLAARFEILDGNRVSQLERYRTFAENTIPSLLPREGHDQTEEFNHPFSSVQARGITGMASKMLGAMLPLNDMPFFQLGLKSGRDQTVEEREYLEDIARRAHKKLTSKNLRDSLFQALKYLITVGNCMVTLEDDFKIRLTRLDHYVTVRNILGDVIEIIYLDFKFRDETADPVTLGLGGFSSRNTYPFDVFYNQVKWNEETEVWDFRRENSEGDLLETGTYEKFALPFVAARWNVIPGEHYGRSYVEEIYGDIISLEAYTESLTETLSASASW